MRRLYFRIVFGLLIILVLSFLLPTIMFRPPRSSRPKTPAPNPHHGPIELLKARLEGVPPEKLEEELNSLKAKFEMPLHLTDDSDKSLPANLSLQAFEHDMVESNLDGKHRLLYVPLRGTGKVLVVGPMPDRPRPNIETFIIVISIVLGIVGILGFLIVAPVVRNLKSLETAASRFGKGDLDSRADIRSRDAVGSVAQQFNLMADSIQKLIQQERQLLQAVSHELRTPIARIRFSLDMLNSAETPQEHQKRIREIDGEILEINQLVGELLDFNRLHSESWQLHKQEFSVRPIIDEVVKRLQDFRPEVGIEIKSANDAQCQVVADLNSFRRAIQNLLSNALRYAGSRVIINYFHEETATVVEISDDGPGIPAGQRDQIMRPFYRVDNSRDKESGGVGLGLAIVSRIIALHQGSIDISDSDIGGARFTIRWPDAEQAEVPTHQLAEKK